MSYTPKQWVCGETITADGLNNIEEGIQDALECCESGGSLPTVTTDDDDKVLAVVNGEWDKAELDLGYRCITQRQIVTCFNGNLVAEAIGSLYGAVFTPSSPIDGDTIIVTLNGTEYELPKSEYGYGEGNSSGPIFTTYPCFVFASESAYFYVPSAGTYAVKIEKAETGEHIETNECFQKAVNNVVGIPLKNIADGRAESSLKCNGAYDDDTYPLGNYATAFGSATGATGQSSFAEGSLTIASGDESHAEGWQSVASGQNSHAEGATTKAIGADSHAEGRVTTASGQDSHAEGLQSVASGNYSHAEGSWTTANHRSQHVFGEWNIIDASSASESSRGTYVEIVGNGTGTHTKSNARTLDWNGNEWLAGTLTLGNTTITEAQLQALLALL